MVLFTELTEVCLELCSCSSLHLQYEHVSDTAFVNRTPSHCSATVDVLVILTTTNSVSVG